MLAKTNTSVSRLMPIKTSLLCRRRGDMGMEDRKELKQEKWKGET